MCPSQTEKPMFQRNAIAVLLTCLGIGWANADDSTTRTSLTVRSIREQPEAADQSRSPIKAGSGVNPGETATSHGSSSPK
jgi:hypothetical protein